jgi:hypothetical protein
MEFRITSSTTKRSARLAQSGALLMEYVIAVGVSGLLLAALGAVLFYSVKNSMILANYLDLNSTSLRTLDQMSRDIRQCSSLASYSPNELVFSDGSSKSNLTFTYNPSSRKLMRKEHGNVSTLLTECDSLEFSIYQRTPMAGTYDQYPTAAANNCKVVAIKWSCSRSIMGNRANTETVQEAKIVLRRK